MVLKRSIKCRNLRNYHYRKRKSFQKKRGNIQHWIQSTIQGKFVVSASLCPIIYQKVKLNYPESFTKSKNKIKKDFFQNAEKNEKQYQTLNDNLSTETINLKKYQINNKSLKSLKEIEDEKTANKNNSKLKHKNQLKENVEKKLNEIRIIQQDNNLLTLSNNSNSKNIKKNKNKPKNDILLNKQKDLLIKQNESLIKKLNSEQLSINVIETINSESPLTKCSVDSGVELAHLDQLQHSDSSSPLLIKELEEINTKHIPETTNFEENVIKLVMHLQNNTQNNNQQSQQQLKSKKLEAKIPIRRRDRVYKLLPQDIDYCAYMIETHGDNFEAMSKDLRNIYLDDSKSISRKIRIFRESPHYEEYLNNKKMANIES